MPKSAKKNNDKLPKLPMLEDNFDSWERKVKHAFFARGWKEMYDASHADAEATAGDEDRQAAWGVITASLNDDMISRIDHVELGAVEELLRAIRRQYYRQTAGTRNTLKKKLQAATLEQHPSLEASLKDCQLTITQSGQR
jgi:hypothetical protein